MVDYAIKYFTNQYGKPEAIFDHERNEMLCIIDGNRMDSFFLDPKEYKSVGVIKNDHYGAFTHNNDFF